MKEDLVYFVHGSYAGVSAFVQEAADERHRNATLVCIGALVPLTYGRLGRSWQHAAELRRLAKEKVMQTHDCRSFQSFWTQHMQDGTADGVAPSSPSLLRSATAHAVPNNSNSNRKRARSDASGHISSSTSEEFLSPDHPALCMTNLLHTFGPLIFPIYRAALLRKRILLLGSAPVQQSCNFVYDLSILAGLPPPLLEVVQSDSQDLTRIQSLFSVGVHDIPFLKDTKRSRRWLACTTDDILSEKKDLYDILVKFPSQQYSNRKIQWSEMRTSEGKEIKATQRDLRRYRLLRSELSSGTHVQPQYRDESGDEDENEDTNPIAPLVRASTTHLLSEVKEVDPGDYLVCEPVSWAAMAYNGFMWWASAGEMEAWESEEARADGQLLDEIPEASELVRQIRPTTADSSTSDQEGAMRERMAEATVLTAYFHRLTTRLLQPLADLVEDADDETVEGVAEGGIVVGSEDVRAMGLDVWSPADRLFVSEAAELYFGREAKVNEGEGMRICGVKVC